MASERLSKTRRQIRTFMTRINYLKQDGIWVAAPGQESIDSKINSWVDETGSVIVGVNAAFQDYIPVEDQNVMWTDFLYVVTYESEEEFAYRHNTTEALRAEQVKAASPVPEPANPIQQPPVVESIIATPAVTSELPSAGEAAPVYQPEARRQVFKGLNAKLEKTVNNA